MSEYPSDWEIANLSDLATIKASNVDKKTKEGQKEVSLCNYMDVFKNPVVSSSLEFMRSTASEREISEFSLSKGDVLLTKDSEVPEEIGIPSVVIEDIPDLVCGYHLYMIKADHSRINPEYLCWTLRSNSSRQYFYQIANGSTRFGLNLKHVEECPVAIPPLPEQKKIAEILSANQRIASALQSKATLLQQLISAVRDDVFQRYKDSGAIEEYSIADLVNAGDLLSIQDGNHGEKHPKASEFRAEGIPFIMASHIREGRFQPDPNKCLSREIVSGLRIGHSVPGDVLLTHKATIGETCVVPANHEEIMLSPQVTLYRLKKHSHITPEFLREWFMSTTFQKEISEMSGQSTRDYIGIKAQQQLHVMVPRDRGIADAITRPISTISDSLRLLSVKLSSTARLQSSLTNDLLSGRKRVSI